MHIYTHAETYMHTYMHIYTHAETPEWLKTYETRGHHEDGPRSHTYVYACMHTYVRTYILKNLHRRKELDATARRGWTVIHIHKYTHTYIHTYASKTFLAGGNHTRWHGEAGP